MDGVAAKDVVEAQMARRATCDWCTISKYGWSNSKKYIGQRWLQVRPLRRQLKQLKAWITGQRKDQSPGTRSAVPVVQVHHPPAPPLPLPSLAQLPDTAWTCCALYMCCIHSFPVFQICLTRFRSFPACAVCLACNRLFNYHLDFHLSSSYWSHLLVTCCFS